MIKTGIISTAYFLMDDYEGGLNKLAQHGYNCVDYQGFSSFANSPLYKMTEKELEGYLSGVRKCAEENGVQIWQLHGAWPHVDDLTEEGRRATRAYYRKNILGAKYLGCPHVVIHPCMYEGWGKGTREGYFAENVKMLNELLPYAEESGVIICLENMPFRKPVAFSDIQELKDIIRAVDSPYIKACLDTGHLTAMGDDIYTSIKLLADDLAVLHVHDDRFGQDRHLIPFQGEVDWQGFVKGLKEIGFHGCISLETSIPPSMPEPMREEMRIQLSKLARYFASEIEG